MKHPFIYHISATILLALSLHAQDTNDLSTWVVRELPQTGSDGWIELFDGKRLFGSDPTNACFTGGKVFIQNGSLWVDNTGIPFQIRGQEVAVRIQAKKISGQNYNIGFGREIGWFNGGNFFGVGHVNQHYEDLKTGHSSTNFNDFFEMEFLVAGGKTMLMANGKTIVAASDENQNTSPLRIHALKGISVFKKIEVKLSDVQSLYPKDETTLTAPTKPDAAERLKKVKELYEQGLINKDDYDKKIKEIMDSL